MKLTDLNNKVPIFRKKYIYIKCTVIKEYNLVKLTIMRLNKNLNFFNDVNERDTDISGDRK